MPESGAVELAGNHPQQIDQHQAHRPPNRGVGPVAIGQYFNASPFPSSSSNLELYLFFTLAYIASLKT